MDKIKHAALGERRVSSYVAAALEDYQEREQLDRIVADWRAETPVWEDVRQQVEIELYEVGLRDASGRHDEQAG